MTWTSNCDDCRSLAATWTIFLIISVLGILAARWRRWTIAPTFIIWAIAARGQLGALYAGMDRGLLYHAFAAMGVGLLGPLLALLPWRRGQPHDGDDAAA